MGPCLLSQNSRTREEQRKRNRQEAGLEARRSQRSGGATVINHGRSGRDAAPNAGRTELDEERIQACLCSTSLAARIDELRGFESRPASQRRRRGQDNGNCEVEWDRAAYEGDRYVKGPVLREAACRQSGAPGDRGSGPGRR